MIVTESYYTLSHTTFMKLIEDYDAQKRIKEPINRSSLFAALDSLEFLTKSISRFITNGKISVLEAKFILQEENNE